MWVAGLIGAVVGALVAWLLAMRGRAAEREAASGAKARVELLDGQVAQQAGEVERLREEGEAARREAAALGERLAARDAQFEEQKALLEAAEKKLTDTFKALGADALKSNSEQFFQQAKAAFEAMLKESKGDAEKRQQAFEHLTKPIKELLDQGNKAVAELEKKREVAYKGLEEQIKHIAQSHEKLDQQTGRLVTALRRPEHRGRWGEMQLRNVVEMAGMTPHCDFTEQAQTDDATTRDRPDMTVNIPGGGVIVVDSKVALDAYLDAIEPGADREACLSRHAKQMETHASGLASKSYWKQFERTPQIVVMFVPVESALTAALEVKPDLHNKAMANHVLIATPTLLVATLRAVAYGWQQEALAENSREIAKIAAALYKRLSTFAGHLERVGKGLTTAGTAYNKAIGSLESMVLPSARQLKAMHATRDEDIATPPVVEVEVRPLVAEELRALPGEERSEG